MAFENREAEHLNRKRLNVVGVPTKDANGNIVSLVVDVTREEGSVTKEGTALTAEALTREIEQIVSEKTQNGQEAIKQCVCDYSNKVATTSFVWDVLMSLGFDKIYHNHNTNTGGSGT